MPTQQMVLQTDLQVVLTQQIVAHFDLRLHLHFNLQVMLTQQIVLHYHDIVHFDLNSCMLSCKAACKLGRLRSSTLRRQLLNLRSQFREINDPR